MTTSSKYFAAHKGGHDRAGGANGLHVQLLWRPQDDDVTVIVDDPTVGIVFAGSVERERALDAFYDLFD